MKKITAITLILLCFLNLLVPVRAHAADISEINAVIDSIPDDWPEAPVISAKAAILMDADSGEILYAKKATEKMYPASTTKLMTSLLTLENASLSDIVDFSWKACQIPAGSSHIGMRTGDRMVLKECLLALLLPSANEVANALAEHVSGTIEAFVSYMNERALQLGCVNTFYVNPNGLHNDDHYTCCYDLALIMRQLCTNNTFTEISGTPSYVHHADDLLPKDIPMMNTNEMVRPATDHYNESVVAGKTGHTDESGYNLVTYAEKDGTHLITVVMGCVSGQEYVSTQSLLDYGFNYFHLVLPAELDESLNMENEFTGSPLRIPTTAVSLFSIDDTDSILLPDNVTFDMLEKELEETDTGRIITYTYQGYPLGSVVLKAGIEKNTDPAYREKDRADLSPEPFSNLLVVDGWLVVLFAGLILSFILIISSLKRRNR